jgi:hypothetical protein
MDWAAARTSDFCVKPPARNIVRRTPHFLYSSVSALALCLISLAWLARALPCSAYANAARGRSKEIERERENQVIPLSSELVPWRTLLTSGRERLRRGGLTVGRRQEAAAAGPARHAGGRHRHGRGRRPSVDHAEPVGGDSQLRRGRGGAGTGTGAATRAGVAADRCRLLFGGGWARGGTGAHARRPDLGHGGRGAPFLLGRRRHGLGSGFRVSVVGHDGDRPWPDHAVLRRPVLLRHRGRGAAPGFQRGSRGSGGDDRELHARMGAGDSTGCRHPHPVMLGITSGREHHDVRHGDGAGAHRDDGCGSRRGHANHGSGATVKLVVDALVSVL